eukprot:GHVL01011790.1.p1 GENE.GHVL01011790.1~~GHVL01011790.1.p1  ORF type:complete len:783 (+),score=158.65 GHVL01011790.1:1281-3629(+)
MEYQDTVTLVTLSKSHSAVLANGRVHVHKISANDSSVTIFPENETDKVSFAILSDTLLVTASTSGMISYISIPTLKTVHQYKHPSGIKHIFPSPPGTRVVVIDNDGGASLHNPVNDECFKINDFPQKCNLVLWDANDTSVFAALSSQSNTLSLTTFVLSRIDALMGTSTANLVENIDRSNVDNETAEIKKSKKTSVTYFMNKNSNSRNRETHVPLLVYDGVAVTLSPGGKIERTTLASHTDLRPFKGNPRSSSLSKKDVSNKKTDDKLNIEISFFKNISLLRLSACLKDALDIEDRQFWKILGRVSLLNLEFEIAKISFRKICEVQLMFFLNKISEFEDKKYLCGQVCLILKKFKQAKAFLLSSSLPESALYMESDLNNFESALEIAKTLSPKTIPFFTCKCAHNLEVQGKYNEALNMYRSILEETKSDENIYKECMCGIARTMIRTGKIPEGVEICLKLDSINLYCTCSALLEEAAKWHEAALLYLKCDNIEKAASLYIRDSDFEAAAPLMKLIKSTDLQLQYAKAKESRGRYSEAVEAYERAKDFESAIRLQLQKLNSIEKAFTMSRQSNCSEGLVLCANYCKTKQNWKGAIEFLVLAKLTEEAFRIAEAHDEMLHYETNLGDNGTIGSYKKIATYYQERQLLPQAGKMLAKCKEYQKALHLLLKGGEEECEEAIEVVKASGRQDLKREMISFLLGDSDGRPKNPKWLYKIHYALNEYQQAARMAVIIAQSSQESGNYHEAHQLLFKTYQDLVENNLGVPQMLRKQLIILHSYILVKASD